MTTMAKVEKAEVAKAEVTRGEKCDKGGQGQGGKEKSGEGQKGGKTARQQDGKAARRQGGRLDARSEVRFIPVVSEAALERSSLRKRAGNPAPPTPVSLSEG